MRRRNMRTSRHITPVLNNASFFSFKRTACLRGQTRLQRQYRLFSFLLLWAAVLLLVLNLLQNSVHLRLWGGPQLCAGSIRDLSTLAREQQLTDWRLFSRPRTNEWEKHQFCMTIGDLSKNLYWTVLVICRKSLPWFDPIVIYIAKCVFSRLALSCIFLCVLRWR